MPVTLSSSKCFTKDLRRAQTDKSLPNQCRTEHVEVLFKHF